MTLVVLTALGVGGASVIGALLGFVFRKMTHRFSDIVLSFAAGVMLCAAISGLIVPSLEYGMERGGKGVALLVSVAGLFCGALLVNVLDRVVPHLHVLSGVEGERHPDGQKNLNRVLLFVIAIALHNLPEGIAAGVGFGTGDSTGALVIALGIALQNLPEGMVIIAPMLAVGISKVRALMVGLLCGAVEVVGTLIGYLAVSISVSVLPFALAFAGGTMLYVISDEMIPETHAHGAQRGATYALLCGFCLMLCLDTLLG